MTIPGTHTIIVAARTCAEHFFKFLDNLDSKTYFSNKSTVTLHIHCTYICTGSTAKEMMKMKGVDI